jgi:hypothetical protein
VGLECDASLEAFGEVFFHLDWWFSCGNNDYLCRYYSGVKFFFSIFGDAGLHGAGNNP